MGEYAQIALLVSVTKLVQIVVGLAFAYFGYNLFRLGVYEKAGELRAAWGERRLALKQAAPGTFFALFGALVIGVSIWRGIEVHVERPGYQPPPPPVILEQQPTSQPLKSGAATSTPPTARAPEAVKVAPKLEAKDVTALLEAPWWGPREQEVTKLVQRLLAGEKLNAEETEKLRSWLRAINRSRGSFVGEAPPDIRLRIGGPT